MGNWRLLNAILLTAGVLALIAVVAFFARQIRHHFISGTEEEMPQSTEDSPVTSRAALRPVIHAFDEVWYGYKPFDEETVTAYRGLLQKVYEAVRWQIGVRELCLSLQWFKGSFIHSRITQYAP